MFELYSLHLYELCRKINSFMVNKITCKKYFAVFYLLYIVYFIQVSPESNSENRFMKRIQLFYLFQISFPA